jgi:RNA polymerase sigma-70 factor (sigma-E family)
VGDSTAALGLGQGNRTVTARGTNKDDLVASLFAEHYTGLCRMAAMLLGGADGAEEAVQEAFLRTYVGWWRIRHPERASSYLRAAVVNQCRSRLRRRASEDRGNRAVWAAGSGPDPAGTGIDDATALVAAVDTLPRRQREAVILRYYRDLPEAEVAAALGCSVGTVKSQLSKARASLGRRLDPDRTPGPERGPT